MWFLPTTAEKKNVKYIENSDKSDKHYLSLNLNLRYYNRNIELFKSTILRVLSSRETRTLYQSYCVLGRRKILAAIRLAISNIFLRRIFKKNVNDKFIYKKELLWFLDNIQL